MIFVYVKHYLNEEGRVYFDTIWYPYVNERIQQQDGFVGIETSRDSHSEDCINITVVFENHDKLMAWVEHKDHQKVINALDPYRTKGQRWCLCDSPNSLPDLRQWEEVSLR